MRQAIDESQIPVGRALATARTTFATFAQAMAISATVMIARNRTIVGAVPPSISMSGRTTTPVCAFVRGYSSCNRRTIVSSSARA